MKKLICFLVVLTVMQYTHTVKAPNGLPFEYNVPAPVPTFKFNVTDAFLNAVIGYESTWNDSAENPVTKARGILQILPIMIDEANRLQISKGSEVRYTWDDAWSVEKSIEIWYLVQNHHNPTYDSKRACQIWFGIGIQYDGMTWKEYHQSVLARMELT
jgi:hypothetical protein